jgi:hypothetical protein
MRDAEASYKEQGYDDVPLTITIGLRIGGSNITEGRISFRLKEIAEGDGVVSFMSDSMFLPRTGDAEVYFKGWNNPPLYAFQVHEPGLTIVTWFIALIGALIGGGLVALAQYLLGDGNATAPPVP